MKLEYKDYIIDDARYSLKVIKPIGRGTVPMGLRGEYNSVKSAKIAIDQELTKKE